MQTNAIVRKYRRIPAAIGSKLSFIRTNSMKHL